MVRNSDVLQNPGYERLPWRKGLSAWVVMEGTVEKDWKVESDVPWPAPLLPDPEKGMVNTYINNSGLKSQIKVYMWQSWNMMPVYISSAS